MRYEYQCPSCGGVVEMRRTMAERHDPVPCPKDYCVSFVGPPDAQVMQRPNCTLIISMPAKATFVGAFSTEQRHEAIVKRNETYKNSARGKEEHAEQVHNLRQRGIPA